MVITLVSEVVELGFGSSFSQGIFKSTCPFPGCRQPLSPSYWSCAMAWRRIWRRSKWEPDWPTGWDLLWREAGSRYLAAVPRLLTTCFALKHHWIKIKTGPGGRVQTQHLSPQREVVTTLPWQRVLFCATPNTPSSSSHVFIWKLEWLLPHTGARAALRNASCAHGVLIPRGLSQVQRGSAWPKWWDLSTEEEKLEVPKYLLLVENKMGSCRLLGTYSVISWRRGEVLANLVLHLRLENQFQLLLHSLGTSVALRTLP